MGLRDFPVYVLSNQKSYWLLPSFCHQFNKYWKKQPVTIVGYGELDRDMYNIPSNFGYIKIDDREYCVDEFSNGLIKFINTIDCKHFILMLEDYWIAHEVNVRLISKLWDWMEVFSEEQNILRVDLTASVARRGSAREYTNRTVGKDLGMVYTRGGQFQLSYVTNIWNKKFLLSVLEKDENPWQSERNGTHRVNKTDLIVLGTKHRPIKYKQVYSKKVYGEKTPFNYSNLKRGDIEELRKLGYI